MSLLRPGTCFRCRALTSSTVNRAQRSFRAKKAVRAALRILIADDNAAVRKTLRALLQSRPELEVSVEARTGGKRLKEHPKFFPTWCASTSQCLNWTASVRPGRYDRRSRKCNC